MERIVYWMAGAVLFLIVINSEKMPVQVWFDGCGLKNKLRLLLC